jgi:alkyl hydroperoxide reductase subunit AhpC
VGYPVVADTAHELARAFGVLEEDATCRRGTFVIDPEGVVRHSTISDGSVGRSAAETLRVLCALRTGELCPASWQPGQPTLIAA